MDLRLRLRYQFDRRRFGDVAGRRSRYMDVRTDRKRAVLDKLLDFRRVLFRSEPGNKAAGWIFAFDCATNSIAAALATSQGEGAGIWMGGQGLTADDNGFLYAITGNGDFDGKTQFGESFVKVQYTPASEGTKASLQVIDHWTPWTDLVRSGQERLPATKLAGQSAPSEAAKPVGSRMNLSLKDATLVANINERGKPVLLVFPKMASGNWSDEDWGSAGPACIFSIGVCVATGKDGIAYPIKTANLGGTTLRDLLANPK